MCAKCNIIKAAAYLTYSLHWSGQYLSDGGLKRWLNQTSRRERRISAIHSNENINECRHYKAVYRDDDCAELMRGAM